MPLEGLKPHLSSPCKRLCRCIINGHIIFTGLLWSTFHPEFLQRWELSCLLLAVPQLSRGGSAVPGCGALPPWCGHGDVNVWLHCLQVCSSHVNIAITWQKQYETNAFVAHLSPHSWEIQNLLTFLAVFGGRVRRCALLDVEGLFLLLEEKCCCRLNFWLWLKVFLYCLLSLSLGSWPCSCTPLACSDSCCPLWIVRNWAKATSLFLVLQLMLWSGSRAFAGQFFLRGCLCPFMGTQLSAHLHLLTWGQPEVSSPSHQTLSLPFTGRQRLWRTSQQLDTAMGTSCISW